MIRFLLRHGWLLVLSAALVRGAEPRRPNVLWLIGENLTTHDLGSYGAKQVRTPHLDALAAQGVRYTSADPAHREALARLRAALDAWMIETGDRGAVAEPAAVVAPFADEMHRWFGTPAWYKP